MKNMRCYLLSALTVYGIACGRVSPKTSGSPTDFIGRAGPTFTIVETNSLSDDLQAAVAGVLGDGRTLCTARGSANGADVQGFWFSASERSCQVAGTMSMTRVMPVILFNLGYDYGTGQTRDHLLSVYREVKVGEAMNGRVYHLCSGPYDWACAVDLRGEAPVLILR